MKIKLTQDGPLGAAGDIVEPETVLQGKLMCQDCLAQPMPDDDRAPKKTKKSEKTK